MQGAIIFKGDKEAGGRGRPLKKNGMYAGKYIMESYPLQDQKFVKNIFGTHFVTQKYNSVQN